MMKALIPFVNCVSGLSSRTGRERERERERERREREGREREKQGTAEEILSIFQSFIHSFIHSFDHPSLPEVIITHHYQYSATPAELFTFSNMSASSTKEESGFLAFFRRLRIRKSASPRPPSPLTISPSDDPRRSVSPDIDVLRSSGTPLRCTPSPLRLECSICLDEAELTDTLELSACQHVFCRACIRAHCLARQSEGITSIACLATGCPRFLSQSELQMVLGDQVFQTFDRRALEQAVAQDRSLHLCPTPDCSFVCAWAGPEDGLPRVICPLCQKDACLICGKSPYH